MRILTIRCWWILTLLKSPLLLQRRLKSTLLLTKHLLRVLVLPLRRPWALLSLPQPSLAAAGKGEGNGVKGQGKLMRLRGGAPAALVQPARNVAGKRRRSAHRPSGAVLFAQRAAQSSAVHSAPSNPSTAMRTDQSAPANMPRPHEAPVDSDSPSL